MAKAYCSLNGDLAQAVSMAAKTLAEGGVVVFPTETVYGIGVVSGNPAALAKLRRLKQREADKPFQILVDDLGMAEALGAVFSAKAKQVAATYWPGPLTMVVPDGSGESSLGIRIPDAPFVLALCGKLGKAIIASSANPAGVQPPADAVAADAFGDDIDLLVDGGTIREGTPSTVIRCLEDGFEVLRKGAISAEAIASAWHE